MGRSKTEVRLYPTSREIQLIVDELAQLNISAPQPVPSPSRQPDFLFRAHHNPSFHALTLGIRHPANTLRATN